MALGPRQEGNGLSLLWNGCVRPNSNVEALIPTVEVGTLAGN